MTQLEGKSNYPITVDSVIFGYADGELKVALIERKKAPFKGMWAIPGGFMEGEETAEDTAARELKEETGLENVFLEQYHVFSSHGRDPRGRTITIAFYSLINPDQYQMVASEDALQAKWWPAYNTPPLAFHQDELYEKGLQALRLAIKTRPLAFELLPPEFTLTQLQNLYETILNIKINRRSFRRKVAQMDFIRATGKKMEGEKFRPPMLYRYDSSLYKTFSTQNFF